jgi:hypothetical protein
MAESFNTDARDGHKTRSDIYWWLDAKRDAKKLQQLITDFQLLTFDNQRIQAYETYASLYTNRRIQAGQGLLAGLQGDWSITKGKFSRCPYNLMKIVIDEASSRITKSHPHAKFLTHGGNRSAQRRAEMMERWNDGEVHKLRQDEMFDAVIKDACQYGLGALKHLKAYHESRVQTLRVYPGNLFVDLEETLFEKPTRLHHRRFVSKTALAAMFPRYKRQVMDSDQVSTEHEYVAWFGHNIGAQDMVEIVESWHLPSYVEGKGDKATSPDGIRVLWIERAVLQISPWNRREFPFSFFNWKRDPHNTFYGIGLGEDLFGVHIDANVTVNRVNTAIETVALPHIIVKKGGKISKAQLGNKAGSIWEYSGNEPPQVVLPNVVPGDLLNYVREHEVRAYRIAGLTSAAQTGGGMPQSLQTGRAVENYFAAESIPFNEQLRKFENFVKHVAENNVAVGREIYEQDKSFSVVLPGDKNTIQEINWSKVALDPNNESYVIRVAPTSALSETPAARLAEIERMVAIGMIVDPAEMRDLFNAPDLESYDDYMLAAKHNVDRMLELAIDENIFSPPMPGMDFQYFIIRATQEEQKSYDYGVPEENVSTLRRMKRRAEELQQREQAAAMTQAAGMITPTVSPQQPQAGTQPNVIQQDTPGQ